MEIWPDLAGERCWSATGAVSVAKAAGVLIRTPIPAPRSTPWPPCFEPSAAAAIRIVTRDGRRMPPERERSLMIYETMQSDSKRCSAALLTVTVAQ
jgi:hypothetical protein